MKTLLTTLTIVLFSNFAIAQDSNREYTQLWAHVFKLEKENLTKSALGAVEKIADKANKEKNQQQQIKTLLFTSKYALILEENAKLEVIKRFKKEIEVAQFPAKNVLEGYLANLYWQYFQQNRYQFYNRTTTDVKIDSVDFRTWDLNTLFHEIQIHFENSLENPEKLQKTELTDFEALLYSKEGSKTYRPSLFDVLAHNALSFYKTDESGITRPADKFELDNPDYLCDAYSFSHMQIASTDSTSLQVKALQVFQYLVQFHSKTKNYKALVAVDTERLKFIHTNAVFADKDTQLLNALQEAAENIKEIESAALYLFEAASVLKSQGDTFSTKNDTHRWKLKEAIALCDKVINNYPKSRGAAKCEVLKVEITNKSIRLTAEQHVPIDQASRILVNYKNFEVLNLTAFKITQVQKAALNDLYPIQKQHAFITKLPIVKTWNAKLKNEGDYQNHSIEIPVPALQNGQYVILASSEKSSQKDPSENDFAFSFIQATNLVLTETRTSKEHMFQVIDRYTGKPKKGANITLYYKRNYRGSVLKKKLVSDVNGFASFPLDNRSFSTINTEINHIDDLAIFNGTYINRKQKEAKPSITYSAFLFQDRSIYRPGQPVYFKGIILENYADASKVAPDEEVTAELINVNGQTVAEVDLKTNEYGSFSGDFVLPTNGLNGQYHIEIYGQSGLIKNRFYFSVEEYKRPKFETSFQPVKETFKVNDSVTVKGKATSFAGSAISNAKVTYSIQRNVNYAPWYYWSRSYVYNQPVIVGFGETTTNAAGEYEIDFKAIPDAQQDKNDLPIFSYTITADVTDINGETHSTTTTVQVGYHAMTAAILVHDQLDKTEKNHEISVSTTNLNGQELSAKGTLKIYKLQSPEYVLRNRPWQAPDYQYWEKSEFKTAYPHDAYSNESDPNTWQKGALVFNTTFDTQTSKQIILKSIKKWESGKYIVELETSDEFGQQVIAKAYTNVFSTKEKQLADNALFHIKTDKSNYEVGDVAELSLYTNAPRLFVTVRVEKDGKIVSDKIIQLKNGCETINIPVTADDVGGFSVNYSFAAFNSYQSGKLPISVPYPNSSLAIETMTFRDKLQPGTDERWSFKIKGPQGEKVTAELLASMYDASLDQFRGHAWYFNPLAKSTYYSRFHTNAGDSFGTSNFRTFTPNATIDYVPSIEYDSFEWFGLDFNNAYYAQRRYLQRERSKLQNKSFTDASIKDGFVNGTVYDESGIPLPGVNVIIKGTTQGVVTDFDGHFSIQAEPGAVITFSYIGYNDQRLTLGTDNSLQMFLQQSLDQLEEVVVTGYGTSKKRSTSASMSVVSEDMEMNIDAALEGKVAGVQVTNAPKSESDSTETTTPDFTGVQIRKNLQETAFFFPKLSTDKEGNVSFNFTSPEALTRWNLQLLAYTKDLKSATKTLTTVTQKELMVLPNPPRFLREGDTIVISSKIANLSTNSLKGIGQLELTDVVTGKTLDDLFVATDKTQDFTVDASGNTQLSWQLYIPEGLQSVQYKIVAKAGSYSDGEQSALPVLNNSMLVTETMPMWVRSNQSKTFVLDKLKDNTSTTLRNHKLTLEITSNPAWYAVQALPYLMEYPYECSEQVFSRYYANTLASHIANSNPSIQEVFKHWASSDALLSNLEKNQELKSIIIQETPWLRDAQSETEQKKRIALLFDLNKMKHEEENALQKLANNQMSSGAWPWFNGGRENRYITQHIVSGLGHLKYLSVVSDAQISQITKKAIQYLDDEFIAEYERMKKYSSDLKKDHLSHSQVQYLYMRSFFKDIKTSKKVDEVMAYYKGQAQQYWTKRNLYSKGMLSLVLHRMNDTGTSKKIIRSLAENSIISDEMGMYWKENTNSWYWYQAPIETQALLIEAFTEIDGDVTTIDNLKIWLLKNKQTNQWKTTKATTEAVYALLLNGSDWLAVTDAVAVTVGGNTVDPNKLDHVKVEAGTGYYKTSWSGTEIKPKMATVAVTKKNNGIAWGALYWQYFEDLDKITSAATPLQLKKKLFLKNNTSNGEMLTEVTTDSALKVGDLIRVRIELKADRDMEFVHMKDMRAAGLEPVNVISQYKWQDGLGYYESTKDASTNFFFDNLPKGVYVFEYDLRVNNSGNFSNGITTIQSMYAPEFSSHSEGVRVKIQ